MTRMSLVLLLPLAACGGGPGFHRPDYEAQARALCDEADGASDPHRALSLYSLAIEDSPRLARAHAGRAAILEKTGRFEEAERSFSMAAEVAVDDVRARHLLARARFHRRRGRIEPAVRDLDRAIALLATWPLAGVEAEARLQRAECRVELRSWEGVLEDVAAAERAGLDGAQQDRAREARIRAEAAKPEERR